MWVVVWLPDTQRLAGDYKHSVSYTPGLGLCRDWFKGGTRDVAHRNSTCILSRPEEVREQKMKKYSKTVGIAG